MVGIWWYSRCSRVSIKVKIKIRIKIRIEIRLEIRIENGALTMSQNQVLYLAKEALGTALLVGGPILGAGLLVGLLVSVFQAMTQIQEQTLAFIPKILAIVVVMLLLGPWMLTVLTTYTTNLLGQLATFGNY